MKKIKRAYLIKKFESAIDRLHLSLIHFPESMEEDELHDLRVEIKKLRSYFNNYRLCKKNLLTKKTHKDLKQIFYEAGEIRRRQIIMQALRKYKLLTKSHDKLLREEIDKSTKQFCAGNKKHLEACDRIRKQVVKNSTSIEVKNVLKVIHAELKTIKVSFDQIEEDRSPLHELRKQIKSLLYFYEILPVEIHNELALNLNYIKALQQEIGNWHDIEDTVSYIRTMSGNTIKAQHSLNAKSERSYQQIKKLFKDFDRKVYSTNKS